MYARLPIQHVPEEYVKAAWPSAGGKGRTAASQNEQAFNESHV